LSEILGESKRRIRLKCASTVQFFLDRD
jgi:hypothetical protein